jgi:class 3 adenylate cyclase
LLIFLVARATPESLSEEVVVAKRFEAIIVVVTLVLDILTSVVATHDSRIRCASGAYGPNGGADCIYNSFNIVIIQSVIVSVIGRPRLAYIVLVIVASIVAYFVGAIVDGGFLPTDYAAIAVILVLCSVAIIGEASADETLKRRNFLDHVRLVRAEARMAAMASHAKAILQEAMPPALLNDDMTLAATTHRSDCATVGISDIYDFAQWSCGLLLQDVMSILDTLLTVCDLGAIEHGVVRAMTYGDSYVVCAGLVSACEEHATKVLGYEQWFIQAAFSFATQRDTEFRVRTSVCTGPLVGAVTGGASVRYVLAGPAFDGAAAGLLSCEPPTVHAFAAPTVTDLRKAAFAAAPLFPSAPPSGGDAPQPQARLQSPAPEALGFAKPVEDSAVDAPQFSCCLLSFASAAAQYTMAEFNEACEDAVGPTLAALPALVFAAFLIALLIEFAQPETRRHPTPLALVGVAVASILSAVVAVLRWKAAAVPLGVLYGMTVFSLALGMVSLAAGDHVLAAPRTMMIYLLAVPALFLRMPWLAQCAAQFVVVLLPSLYWVVVEHGLASGVYLMILTPLIVFFVMRYFMARALCEMFVAATLTEHALLIAFDRSVEHDKLLAGVLPPHAIRRDGMLVTTASELGANAMEQWASLSTLQVAMRGTGIEAGPALPAVCTVWSDVQQCIAAAGGGLLEMVQATGDTFLVAGPFNRVNDGVVANDQRQVDTACCVVALVQELQRMLAGRCVFKGVAASGTASGALLGASLLSFRLFGPVVRESNALLAAAPDVSRAVAFASTSFRQQHRNFVAPAVPTGISRHMSVAALLSLRDLPPATTDETTLAVPSRAATANDVFGDAAQWRVRGVGVAAVSAIHL